MLKYHCDVRLIAEFGEQLRVEAWTDAPGTTIAQNGLVERELVAGLPL